MAGVPDNSTYINKGTGRKSLKRSLIFLGVVSVLCIAPPTWNAGAAKWNQYQAQRAYEQQIEQNEETIAQAKTDFVALLEAQKAEAKKRGDKYADFDKRAVKIQEQFENKLDQLRSAQDQARIDTYVKSSMEKQKSYFLRDDINILLHEGLALSKKDDKLWSQLSKEAQAQRGKAPELTDSASKDYEGRVRFLDQLKARKTHVEGSIVLAKKLLEEQKAEREALEKRYIDGLNAYRSAKSSYDQIKRNIKTSRIDPDDRQKLLSQIPNLPNASTTSNRVSGRDNAYLEAKATEFEDLAKKYQASNDNMGKAIDAFNSRGSAKKAASAAKYGLTVRTVPSNAKVSITNIKPRYTDGIQLVPGTYNIKVTATGYEPEYTTVRISNKSHTETVRLTKKVAQSSQKPATQTAKKEPEQTESSNPLKKIPGIGSLFGN